MLHKIRLMPGLDKQSSDTGAEGKWVNADYARFRYGFPEKVGGWEQLVNDNLPLNPPPEGERFKNKHPYVLTRLSARMNPFGQERQSRAGFAS